MLHQSITSRSGAVWELRKSGDKEWLPAETPGSVHTDLLRLGRIPDPFVADNELKVTWIAESDWEYKGTFTAGPDLAKAKNLRLVSDGLDTLSEVTLNGKKLGKTDNMFRTYVWDVAGQVKEGKNEILIQFPSALNFGHKQDEAYPINPPTAIDLGGGVHVRKAPCHFGWDWGPKLPPSGVWRDLRLEAHDQGRFEDVRLTQTHKRGTVTVRAQVSAETWTKKALKARLTVTAPNGRRVFRAEQPLEGGKADLSVRVTRPQLWWPNGYGAQPLYAVKVELVSAEKVEDVRDYKIGFRTIELEQKKDQWGQSFAFIVNGVKVFMKGADWIPADSFPTRLSDENYEHLIRSAAESHQNMLRIWGGGIYEDERFYDLCDRYGILLWQDFMFACNIYPHSDPAFVENLRLETVDVVRRLRHRTCIALWCGNNEMEQGWADWGWQNNPSPIVQKEKDAYVQYFYHTLPAWLEELDDTRPYWPSSASSNIPLQEPNSEKQGDMHYWDVWHGRKPFTAYRSTYPRFMSEFGFQALPPIETIATYAEPKDWNMTSYIMELHQRSGAGNGLMIGQMTETFRMPADFPKLSYLSMLLQAEGIRYGVEHWRRHMERVSGTLYWQLNDCWPVASWASIDYFGRWKALHYAAKRFYAPLLLSVEDAGTQMSIHLTSDLTAAAECEVRWMLSDLDGKLLRKGKKTVTVPALADLEVETVDFAGEVQGAAARNTYFRAELWQDGKYVSCAAGVFVPNKHLELKPAGLKAEVRKDGKLAVITVTADSLARFVEVKLVDCPPTHTFSDNYFDVPAGTAVSVSCALPAGWTLAKLRRNLRLTSLYESYQG